MEKFLAQAREYKARAQAIRRDRAEGLALQALTGGYRAAPVVSETIANQDSGPEIFELKAAECVEAARDALVELVADYREIKSLATAVQESHERTPARRVNSKSKGTSD
jgi:hypothetical protein